MIVTVQRGKKLNTEKPLDAIRLKCLDCCGYCPSKNPKINKQYLEEACQEVLECNITTCVLHPFRMGKNPFYAKSDPQQSDRVLPDNPQQSDRVLEENSCEDK